MGWGRQGEGHGVVVEGRVKEAGKVPWSWTARAHARAVLLCVVVSKHVHTVKLPA